MNLKEIISKYCSKIKIYLKTAAIGGLMAYTARIFLYEPYYWNSSKFNIHLDDLMDPILASSLAGLIYSSDLKLSRKLTLIGVIILGRVAYELLEYLTYLNGCNITPVSRYTLGGSIKDILVFSIPMVYITYKELLDQLSEDR